MAQRFFRLQEAGISFEDMKNFNSFNGEEVDGFEKEKEGLCVTDRIGDNFGGAWGAYDGDEGEVVVLEGRVIEQIYDGYRIRPTKEIARFSVSQWQQMLADETAWDLEKWC